MHPRGSDNPAGASASAAESIQHLAQGEAAMMLLECLFVVLIERQVLTAQDLFAAIDTARATKRQMTEEGEHPAIAAAAAGLLARLGNSLASAGAARHPAGKESG